MGWLHKPEAQKLEFSLLCLLRFDLLALLAWRALPAVPAVVQQLFLFLLFSLL